MGVGTEVRSCPKCLDAEQVSTLAFAAMAERPAPSRGRGLIDAKAERVFEVHVGSEAPHVRDRPTQRKKQLKVRVKQLKHTQMKNAGEDIIQTALNTSEVCNCYTKPIVPTKCKW